MAKLVFHMLVRVTAEKNEFASKVLCLYVYTRCKHGIPEKQIFEELMYVQKDTYPSHNTIFRWFREIQTGYFKLQKGKSPRETHFHL